MDNVKYYVRDRNHVQGPFDLHELERRVRTRRLARHHQVSADRIEWRRAADAIPGLFQTGTAPPPPDRTGQQVFEVDEYPQPDFPEILTVTPLPPQQVPDAIGNGIRQFRLSGQWSGVIVIALGALAIVTPLGLVAWLIMLALSGSPSDQAIGYDVGPRLATVQGIHPRDGKKKCYAIVVSRNQVVAPVFAATLDGLKVESRHKDGHAEWHSAQLVTADPVTGLCVLRADVGRDVEIMALPESRELPARKASLRLLMPDLDDSRHIERGTLVKVFNSDEPDEMLQVEFDNSPDPQDAPLGRVVVDARGVLVGMVVSRLPDGGSLCAPAREIRSKKKEAGKFPTDHVLGRIDLPEAPVPTKMPPADRRAESSANSEPVQSSDRGTKQTTKPDEKAVEPTKVDVPVKPMPAAAGEMSDKEMSVPPPKKSPKSKTREKDSAGKAGGALPAVARLGTDLVRTAADAVVPLPELSRESAGEIGNTLLEDVCSKHRRTRDRGLQARIRSMADDILRAAGKKPQEYTVTVVEDDELQAYAFVGGNVIVNTGFIDFAAEDDEMIRFVLAHEIGHLVRGHVDMPFRRELLVGTLVPGLPFAADTLNTILKNSPFNQVEEEEADCFAVDIHRKKNWSIKGGVRFFWRIRDHDLPSDDTDTSGGLVDGLFSSHPDHERRVELLTGGCDS